MGLQIPYNRVQLPTYPFSLDTAGSNAELLTKTLINQCYIKRMMTIELFLRKPVDADVESMYIMLGNSLSSYQTVNNSSSRNFQLIIDRNIVEDYVKRDVYLCLVA